MQNPQKSFNLEIALFETEEKYRRLTQLMPIAVYSTDQDGLITFYNEKAAEIWGRYPRLNDPTELLFCGSWKLYEPDGTPMLHNQCPMAKALRFRRSYRSEEIRIERPDGSHMAALVNIDPIYGADGELVGAINVFHDITERKRIEDDLRRLAAIVESSEDAIISKSLEGIITSWNHGAERLFGYAKEEILGKPITLLIPPAHQQEEQFILGKIRNGELVDTLETTRVAKDGRQIPVSLSVSPVRNAKGQIIGASKIARDISEQVLVQQQLQLYNEKLQQLNIYKDEFISMASHELKTPLTVIKAHLQLMELELQEANYKSYLNKALLHVDKLTDLVSDLLDVSRIQAGKLQLNFTSFNMDELLDESIENLQLTRNSHQIVREGHLGNIMVTADKPRIEQVIINLLTNAIKYSPEADRVIVGATVGNGEVMVSVKDFGIGIPDEQLENVFSRFFRVEGLAHTFSGLGIGLFISKEIIERHQGKMWVESEEGKGSTFYFKIPVLQ